MRLLLALAIAAVASVSQAENSAPFCTDLTPIYVPCGGATTTATLTTDAYDPDGDAFTIEWLPCPGAYAVDPTSATTDIVINTSVTCDIVCGIRTRLTDEFGAIFVCRQYIAVYAPPQGCTPGYWKNHPQAWAGAGYAPTDDYDTVFGVDAFNPNITLMQAAWLGGGKLNKLARHSVAALLSAADSEVNYPRSVTDVLDSVHAAITSRQYEPLATNLDADNNLGCPKN